jgi:hypothetical protein
MRPPVRIPFAPATSQCEPRDPVAKKKEADLSVLRSWLSIKSVCRSGLLGNQIRDSDAVIVVSGRRAAAPKSRVLGLGPTIFNHRAAHYPILDIPGSCSPASFRTNGSGPSAALQPPRFERKPMSKRRCAGFQMNQRPSWKEETNLSNSASSHRNGEITLLSSEADEMLQFFGFVSMVHPIWKGREFDSGSLPPGIRGGCGT